MNKVKRFVCPLLKNPELYKPDTTDLAAVENERNYWLPCLEQMVKKFVGRAASLNPDNPLATEKAELCYQKFRKLIKDLGDDSKVLSPLSVRTLLDFNEENLRASGFKDAWRLQKEKESSEALKEFPSRINKIDSISPFEEKWKEVITGALAGNVFDWGSKSVADILDQENNFGLSQAMEKIQQRPWFHDDMDLWIKRLKKQPYKTAVVFVDNSGVDFVLGILPLARELLLQGSRVILTANSLPALNDVTYEELNMYCCKAAQFCPVLKESINNSQLITCENGQTGPCLDLSNISSELCNLMLEADLVIIEGMGRAVHTNLYAKFKVDSVKMAVLKNDWLAKSLGAKQFAVIFNYENKCH